MTSSAPAQPPGERGLDAVAEIARRLIDNLETVVHGKSEEIRLVLSALVAGGHVLLEDVPGTAKTILARAIAGSVEGIDFSRIQCTPDLQPTDATGLSIFDQERRSFVFQPGPLFANMVLVDEINRATPKTQSALLEAMAERQVTADGVTRPLPDPFMLVATENPIEYEGTFPLPEAQLDRFFLRATLGYPGEEAELQIVREQRHGHPLDSLAPVLGLDEFADLRRASARAHGGRSWLFCARLARAREDGPSLGAPPGPEPRAPGRRRAALHPRTGPSARAAAHIPRRDAGSDACRRVAAASRPHPRARAATAPGLGRVGLGQP